MGWYIWLCIGAIVGFVACALLSNSKITDLEYKLWELRFELIKRGMEKEEVEK